MINTNPTPPFTVYFLSNSGNSYLSEYINTDVYYESFDISFKEFDIKKMKLKKPAAIVVDLYFTEFLHKELIDTLIENFSDEQIYFLSPEFMVHNRYFQDKERPNHFFSSFSLDIIKHITDLIEGKGQNNNTLSDAG